MNDFSPSESNNSEERQRNFNKNASHPSLFRSLTRLIIGGALLGVDELLSNLEKWETQASDAEMQALASNSVADYTDDDDAEIITITSGSETNVDLMRYTLIGMAFDAQDRLQSGANSLSKFATILNRMAVSITKPINNSKITAPLRRRYDQLVLRGQQEVDRWVEIGRTEDASSRSLAQSAFHGSVDQSINYFATNQEIQELIQSQSVGLASEIVEEARERTVSADDFFEGIIRAMFRRPPRSELPEPPQEVREQAVPFRQIRGRIIRK